MHYYSPIFIVFVCNNFIYTNRRYGNGGAASSVFSAPMQNTNYINDAATGLNAYLNALENFNPNFTGDIWRWIPQGLPYDLIDAAGEVFPVIDNVSAYTNGQCFLSLTTDVRSIPAFQNKLLSQNGNFQQVEVNQLIIQYGY